MEEKKLLDDGELDQVTGGRFIEKYHFSKDSIETRKEKKEVPTLPDGTVVPGLNTPANL